MQPSMVTRSFTGRMDIPSTGRRMGKLGPPWVLEGPLFVLSGPSLGLKGPSLGVRGPSMFKRALTRS